MIVLSTVHFGLQDPCKSEILENLVAMFWVPSDVSTSEAHDPTEELLLEKRDRVGLLDSRRITLGNHETVEEQWTHDPNLSGHETSIPFMDTVSDLPLRNHHQMDRADVSMNVYGRFYQGSHHPTDTRPMTIVAGSSSLIWPCPHAAYYGAPHADSGSPMESRSHSEENLVEAHWTYAANHRYERIPTARFGYEVVPQNPWNGVMLEPPGVGEIPEAVTYASCKCPQPRQRATSFFGPLLTVPRSYGGKRQRSPSEEATARYHPGGLLETG